MVWDGAAALDEDVRESPPWWEEDDFDNEWAAPLGWRDYALLGATFGLVALVVALPLPLLLRALHRRRAS